MNPSKLGYNTIHLELAIYTVCSKSLAHFNIATHIHICEFPYGHIKDLKYFFYVEPRKRVILTRLYRITRNRYLANSLPLF